MVHSSLLTKLTWLFSFSVKVEINYRTRSICISQRRFWFLTKKHRFDFSEVQHIDYVQRTTTTDYDSLLNPTDAWEAYDIYLVTRDDKRHKIAMFAGEASVESGWCGWMLGDELIDFEGTQTQRYLQFMELLEKTTGFPVGCQFQPTHDVHICPQCNRNSPLSRTHCMYCGAQF